MCTVRQTRAIAVQAAQHGPAEASDTALAPRSAGLAARRHVYALRAKGHAYALLAQGREENRTRRRLSRRRVPQQEYQHRSGFRN